MLQAWSDQEEAGHGLSAINDGCLPGRIIKTKEPRINVVSKLARVYILSKLPMIDGARGSGNFP